MEAGRLTKGTPMKTYTRKPETIQAYKWEGLDFYTEDDANYISPASYADPERACPFCKHKGKDYGEIFVAKNMSEIVCPGSMIVVNGDRKKRYNAKVFFEKYEES